MTLAHRASTHHTRGLVPAVLAGLVVFAAPAAEALAAVCYQLPFPNPNLADGWGSTCCGRTISVAQAFVTRSYPTHQLHLDTNAQTTTTRERKPVGN